MGDYFRPLRRKIGATVLALTCLFAAVSAIRGATSNGGDLKFRLEATAYAIEFGIDRTRYGDPDLQSGNLVIFSMTYWSIAIVTLTLILSLLLLVSKPPRRQPKFEPVRVDQSRATGSKAGRGKRICFEQIMLHLSNIHNIWIFSGRRR